jgi:hypothetical protein
MRVSILMSVIWTIFACPIGAKRVLKTYRSLDAQVQSQSPNFNILSHSVNSGLNIIQRSAGGCDDPTLPVTCPDGKTPHL